MEKLQGSDFDTILSEPSYTLLKQLLNNLENKESFFEIEKKFLLKVLPDNLDTFEHSSIEQFYLFTWDPEVRIRKEDDSYILTMKKGKWECRVEKEHDISLEIFQSLLPLVKSSISKKRYKIPLDNNLIAELNLYPDWKIVIEVEFPNQESADTFIAPEWFWEEVTTNSAYYNANLATPLKDKKLQNITLQCKPNLLQNNKIEKLFLEEGYQRLVNEIRKLSEHQDTVVVCVAGGSASGKTSQVAKRAYEEFQDNAMIISMDNYYQGISYMESYKQQTGQELNFDQPEVLDIALLQKHLQLLKQGISVDVPNYNFKKWEREGYTSVLPKKIIIIEGLFSLVDTIAHEADIKTYVDVSFHWMLLRRLMRDIHRGSRSLQQNMEYILKTAEPMKQKYIDPSIRNSDFIIINDYNPHKESSNANVSEQQIKFEWTISFDSLRKLGIEKLWSTKQTDYYFNSPTSQWECGEFVKIRQEGDSLIFGYKWPQLTNWKKYKLEFEISDEIKNNLFQHYGEIMKVISKEREVFSFNGIVFSIDKITDTHGKKRNFIEFRFSDKMSNEEISQIYEKFWLDEKESINDSYFNII